MESETDEAINYYINEVNDSANIIDLEDEPTVFNETEEAAEFLTKVGLSDLTRLYSQGKAISENVINNSVREKHLTERQAQTIRSRIETLNRTLQNRQPRRKQRQDIRDISWNLETSSTGTRSRSATPDSLDSVENYADDIASASDEDQQLSSLPAFPLVETQVHKTKVKLTSSEPLVETKGKKINRSDKGDVAHLGSENVVLKGYQPLSEYGTLRPQRQRERSGSDPSLQLETNSSNLNTNKGQTSTTKVYLNGDCDHNHDQNESNLVSFEGIIKQQNKFNQQLVIITSPEQEQGINIDEFTDIEYQYLKPLLYLELVAIFDQYKLVLMKRKMKTSKGAKGSNVFGVNLSTLVMRDMPGPTDNFMIPEIFQTVINHLNTRCIAEDGILRIAGQKQKLEILCNEIESRFYTNRQTIENMLQQATSHELTGVLKKLLRDLPDPVFTMELFDMFYKTSMISNQDDQVKALNLLVLMLPMEHRNTFRLLIQFFLNVIKHEDKNRMSLHNVAMITAPSFFPPRLLLPKENNKIHIKQLTKEELTKQINGAAVCCCIMESMLKAGEQIWIIPRYLANQAREAQKKAQDRKDHNKNRQKMRIGKTKLVRSSTQYEAGAMNVPRIRRDIFI